MSCFGGGTLVKIGGVCGLVGVTFTGNAIGVCIGAGGFEIGIGDGDNSVLWTFEVLSGSIPESPDPWRVPFSVFVGTWGSTTGLGGIGGGVLV